jgi:glycerol-3-phosphate acyltransferase PlsY
MLNLGYIAGAYLTGAFPHLYVLGRMTGHKLAGDLHMGLWRVGRLIGLLGVLLDMGRGVVVVIAGWGLGLDTNIVVLGALAAVAGQMWPVFLHFDGEKGNSIAVGVAATLTLVPFLLAAIPMAIAVIVRNLPRMKLKKLSLSEKLEFGGPPSLSLPLGMAAGFAVLPLASWWHNESRSIIVGYAVLFVLILLRRATAGSDLEKDTHVQISPARRLINRLLYDRPEL